MWSLKRFEQQLFFTLLSASLTGYMVGPDFHSPKAPTTKKYTQSPLPKKTTSTPSAGESGKAQTFLTQADLPAEWWRLFHSRPLNELINRGLAHSPNLAAAQATLRQAQETLSAQIGNSLFPAVNASLGGQRERSSGASFGSELTSTIFNVFNATVNVSYTPDVFGGARRQIESLQAQVD